MSLPRRHQIWNAATVTATGNSGSLPNLGKSGNPTVVAILNCTVLPTGTSPTLTITISSAVTGSSNFIPLGSFTVLNTSNCPLTNPIRMVLHDVLESQIQVSWVATGTTPSFTGLSLDLIFTSPDA